MPLDADGERVSFKFNGFNCTVLCPGADVHTGSGSVYGLMMKTVDLEQRTEALSDQTSAFCADAVARFTP